MPDLDRFDRSLNKGWRQPARIIAWADTPESAAKAAGEALWRYLKERDALTLFKKFYDALIAKKYYEVSSDFKAKLIPEYKIEIFDQIRLLERSSEERVLSGIIGRVCREIIVETYSDRGGVKQNISLLDNLPNFRIFLERVNWKITECELHSKLDSLCDSKYSWHQADFRYSYKEILQDDYIKPIARVLSEYLGFHKAPKFPKIKSTKPSTKELLNMPIALE